MLGWGGYFAMKDRGWAWVGDDGYGAEELEDDGPFNVTGMNVLLYP